VKVSYHLYYPEEAAARWAAAQLGPAGYVVETRPGVDGVRWLVVASAEVAEADFDAAERRMESFARSSGGTFDGYEEGG
jgi:hypothetical protein